MGLAVGIESIGIPFPGETTLIAVALYAGTSHDLNILFVVVVAAAGAVIGDNIGFLAGRRIGLRLLMKYGRYIRMTPPRIKLGQYLFLQHGGKIVFFGRFVAFLRALAAFLAAANRMSWPRFLVFNAAGGMVWAGAYGFGAYFLGTAIHRFVGPAGMILGALAVLIIIAGAIFLSRNEKHLVEKAEKALPGRKVARKQT